MTDIPPYQIPVEETIKTSWNKISGVKGTIWIALIITFAIFFAFGLLDKVITDYAPKIEPIYSFITQIIMYLFEVGLIYMGIRRAQDAPINFDMIFYPFKGSMALKIILLYILQILIFLIPIIVMVTSIIMYKTMSPILSISLFILGVIGIIYLAVRLLLSVGYVVDKNMRPWDAIKHSFLATNGNFWRIVFIFFLQGLILIICAIPLGIGLIWGLPFSLVNYGVVYRNLSSNYVK